MSGTTNCPSNLNYQESQCTSLSAPYMTALKNDLGSQGTMSFPSNDYCNIQRNSGYPGFVIIEDNSFNAPIQSNPNIYDWGIRLKGGCSYPRSNSSTMKFGLYNTSGNCQFGIYFYFYLSQITVSIFAKNGTTAITLDTKTKSVINKTLEAWLYYKKGTTSDYLYSYINIDGSEYIVNNYAIALNSDAVTSINRKPILSIDTQTNEVYFLNYFECWSHYGTSNVTRTPDSCPIGNKYYYYPDFLAQVVSPGAGVVINANQITANITAIRTSPYADPNTNILALPDNISLVGLNITAKFLNVRVPTTGLQGYASACGIEVGNPTGEAAYSGMSFGVLSSWYEYNQVASCSPNDTQYINPIAAITINNTHSFTFFMEFLSYNGSQYYIKKTVTFTAGPKIGTTYTGSYYSTLPTTGRCIRLFYLHGQSPQYVWGSGSSATLTSLIVYSPNFPSGNNCTGLSKKYDLFNFFD